MKTYLITKITGTPDWNKIPTADIDTCQWGYWADVTAKAQLCYDDEAIYAHFTAREANIRNEEHGQTAMPCLDSCMEFFFAPIIGNKTYFNIEMNPNCAMYLGIGTDRYDLIRLLLPDDGNLGAQASRTEDGWELTYTIPVSLIQRFFPEFKAESGAMMRGNFYKCGDYTVKEHYFAWNPVECENPDFHLPQWFGKLYFE